MDYVAGANSSRSIHLPYCEQHEGRGPVWLGLDLYLAPHSRPAVTQQIICWKNGSQKLN